MERRTGGIGGENEGRGEGVRGGAVEGVQGEISGTRSEVGKGIAYQSLCCCVECLFEIEGEWEELMIGMNGEKMDG